MLSRDQAKGLALACSSAVFIGSSFIIKKKGLRAAGAKGIRAGAPGAQVHPDARHATRVLHPPRKASMPRRAFMEGRHAMRRHRRLLLPGRAAVVDGHADHGGRRGCQLCSVCLCAGYSGDSLGSAQHHCQVLLPPPMFRSCQRHPPCRNVVREPHTASSVPARQLESGSVGPPMRCWQASS